MKRRVYFRADGNSKIGLGHVIRSLALADMLKEDFECHFIIQNPLRSIRKQILEICHFIIELPEREYEPLEAEYILENYIQEGEIVVLDGYNFVTGYQQVFKSKECKLVCIDDIHNYHFLADAIINHAGGIKKEDYSTESYTEFCLGMEFALLRRPFRDAAQNRIYPYRNNDEVFICMGGADPNNDIIKILKKCAEIPYIRTCNVVIGVAYSRREELELFLEKTTLNVNLLANLSAPLMREYMSKCGIAITSPSTIAYEFLSVGGLLYLYLTADNQKHIKEYLLKTKLAYSFNESNFTESEHMALINTSIKIQQELIDGKQKKRLLKLFYYLGLKSQKAGKEDCRLYFDWINDPKTREQSFSSSQIPFEDHKKWFDRKVEDESSKLYLISMNGQPIGQIRFDFNKREAIISYSLDKEYRGKGLGGLILKKGIDSLKKEIKTPIDIVGFVKKTNIASSKAFRQLEFRESLAEEFDNSYKYTL